MIQCSMSGQVCESTLRKVSVMVAAVLKQTVMMLIFIGTWACSTASDRRQVAAHGDVQIGQVLPMHIDKRDRLRFLRVWGHPVDVRDLQVHQFTRLRSAHDKYCASLSNTSPNCIRLLLPTPEISS